MVEAKNLNLIRSGIEPVDNLLGGLERGHLYLAQGDAAGKSLFGITFLIEGLKRGEPGALIIRYAPEDAVRRFARLGYDCLDDVKQNRLVILEYTDDIVKQIADLNELTPVLRELSLCLRKVQPQRIVFDPILPLVGKDSELASCVRSFTRWVASFGATVLMVANGDHQEAVNELKPHVRESFRFDVKDNGDFATRYFAFEKSPELLAQAIEVDPRRGVFLLQRSPREMVTPEAETVSAENQALLIGEAQKDEAASCEPESDQNSGQLLADTFHPVEINGDATVTSPRYSASVVPFPTRSDREAPPSLPSETEAKFVTAEVDAGFAQPLMLAAPGVLDDLSEFLSEIDQAIGALRMPIADAHQETTVESPKSPPVLTAPETAQIPVQEMAMRAVGAVGGGYGRRASDFSDRRRAIARERRRMMATTPRPEERRKTPAINPENFNILIIDEDAFLCARLAKALNEYSVTTVQDGLKGIANVLALNPDLIILDVDMAMADGFKVLAQIRASISAPIITLSQSRQRASDKIFSTELGSDYYLTKPLNLIELKQKTRQLIARYRGINSWISDSPVLNRILEEMEHESAGQRLSFTKTLSEARQQRLVTYEQFVAQVEAKVKVAVEQSTSFAIVGFDLDKIKQSSEEKVLEIFDLVSQMVRSDDVLAKNPRHELVVLLCDTDAKGAKAFIQRTKQRITEQVNDELLIWLRSFPSLEEEFEQTAGV